MTEPDFLKQTFLPQKWGKWPKWAKIVLFLTLWKIWSLIFFSLWSIIENYICFIHRVADI